MNGNLSELITVILFSLQEVGLDIGVSCSADWNKEKSDGGIRIVFLFKNFLI